MNDNTEHRYPDPSVAAFWVVLLLLSLGGWTAFIVALYGVLR